MPYVTQQKRACLDSQIEALHRTVVDMELDDPTNNTEGNLNYTITRLLHLVYGTSYRDINDAIGLLECIKLEYYRKVAAPYEDFKEKENGPINSDSSSNTHYDPVVVEATE